MKTEPTLQEKTTAMEKAIRMAKEVHEQNNREPYTYQASDNFKSKEDTILTTAKQIYDWLLNS
jgi:hypothetical protein